MVRLDRIPAIILLAVLGGHAVIAGGPTSAAVSSGFGAIAFAAPGRESRVFTVNSDGSGLQELVSNAGSPVWSPDRSRLVVSRYVRAEDARGNATYRADLYTIRSDGSDLRSLVRDGGYAAWSPDGQSIAFLRDGLWTVRLDGSRERRLVEKDAADPVWSPDGRWIAFTWYDRAPYGVWLIRPDGTGLRRLVRGRLVAEVAHPDWAPDGRQVSFVGLYEDEGLYVVGVNGRGVRKVARSSRANEWSPVGRRILFTHEHLEREPNGLWSTSPNGRDQERLALRVSDPDWSPDGASIAFLRRGKIVVMNADGTGAHQVTRLAARELDWDGSHP